MEKKDFTEFLREYVEVAIDYNQRILDGVKGLLPLIEDYKSPADMMIDFEEYVYSTFDPQEDTVLIEEVLEIANDCLTGAMEDSDAQENNENYGPPISWN